MPGSGGNDAAHEARPSWSPDGSRIVFSCGIAMAITSCMPNRVTDGATVKLTDNEVDDWLPAWSPDGTSIAYIRSDGFNELRMISADGSSDRAVPGPTVAPGGPPGRPMARGSRMSRGGMIWMVNANGGEPTPGGRAAARRTVPRMGARRRSPVRLDGGHVRGGT